MTKVGRPRQYQNDAERQAACRLRKKQRLLHQIPVVHGEGYTLYQGDCALVASLLPAASVAAIVTDPPYGKDALPLYGDLARLAARLLQPGGSLLVMCGQAYLDRVMATMDRLGRPLVYHWELSYHMLGANTSAMHAKKLDVRQKPILWYVQPPFVPYGFVHDVVVSPAGARDKRYHPWGQSEAGMALLVQRYTAPGGLILDPFMGAATTGAACLTLGRAFVGIELDTTHFQVACARLDDATRQGQLFAPAVQAALL